MLVEVQVLQQVLLQVYLSQWQLPVLELRWECQWLFQWQHLQLVQEPQWEYQWQFQWQHLQLHLLLQWCLIQSQWQCQLWHLWRHRCWCPHRLLLLLLVPLLLQVRLLPQLPVPLLQTH